jgi:hypothetical protein
MARLDGLGGFKSFNIDCKSSRYDKLADAAGFDMGPRLGRMVASLIILPKKRSAKRKTAAKKR